MTDVSTTCAVVIFRVNKVSRITSVDGIIKTRVIDLIGQLSRDVIKKKKKSREVIGRLSVKP